MKQNINRQSLYFFLITFLITWGCHIPYVASIKGILPFRPPVALLFLGVFGPLIAALFLTAYYSGMEGVKGLLKKFLIWKVSWKWYAIALLTAAAIRFAGLEILAVFEGPLPGVTFVDPAVLLLSLPQWILIVPIEEIGWRGYALPRLQTKFNALNASLILGILWGTWHVPLMFIQPNRMIGGSLEWGIGIFLLSTLLATIFMAWIYNSTNGSLLIVTLFHAANNTAFSIFDLPVEYQFPHILITLSLAVLVIIWVVWRNGVENLSNRDRVKQSEVGPTTTTK